ncbi:MAG: lyase [Gemmatimonadales bacterium]|nr:MAG: lyase [Gemmatimonadales bacterium]
MATGSELEFEEWDVPWEDTRPRDPFVGLDGSIWFVGQLGDYMGFLDPESGEMYRYALPEGSGPHNVIVDTEGFPWYAGNGDAHIGRLDPATGEVLRYDMPEGVRDPHTMIQNSSGEIWFTAQRSAPAGYVARFSPVTGAIEAVGVPGEAMRPYGIVLDSGDRPWVAFMGSNRIGTVDPETLELEIFETPFEGSRIRRIGVTSDDRIWWVDAAYGFVGVFDPVSGDMDQWQSPGGEESGLYAMAIDAQDRIWYVESNRSPNRFVGFDPTTEEFFSMSEVPSGGGNVRHMVFDAVSNAIWFATDTHTIGRAIIP